MIEPRQTLAGGRRAEADQMSSTITPSLETNMKSLRCCLLVGLMTVTSVARLPADTPAEALTKIPGNAISFICIPDPVGLDADIQSTLNKLGVAAMVPLPGGSVLKLLKMRVPAMENMADDHSFAIAMLPGEEIEDLKETQLILLPASDPESMLEAMDAELGDDEVWSVNVFGKDAFAMVRKNYVVIAKSEGMLSRADEADGAIADVLSETVAGQLSDLDVIVGFNAGDLANQIKPLLKEKFYPMLDAQAKTEMEKKSTEINKRQIDRLVDGLELIVVGLRIEDQALALRMTGKCKKGSDLDKSVYLSTTGESLLTGLPKEAMALAMGQIMDKKQAQVQVDSLREMMEILRESDDIDTAKLDRLEKTLETWMMQSGGYAMSIVPLESDGHGVLGMTMVVNCDDSAAWLASMQDVVTQLKELAPELDENVAQYADAISLEDEGDGVMSLSMDLSEIGDEDSVEMAENILGAPMAISIRVAGDDRVVFSLGGGERRAESVVEAVERTGSSAERADFEQKLNDLLPLERNSTTYLFVDQCVELARGIMAAIDEEDLPFATPDANTPIAVTSTGGDDWWTVELILPMEVIEAGRDIGLTMMGQR